MAKMQSHIKYCTVLLGAEQTNSTLHGDSIKIDGFWMTHRIGAAVGRPSMLPYERFTLNLINLN